MKEQTKKYAYYEIEDRQLPVSEALRLRNDGKLETKGESPVLFDFKNSNIRSGVFPVSSSSKKVFREAHYRYYNKYDKKIIVYPKEMTNAHLLFQRMFLNLDKFSVLNKKTNKRIRVALNWADMEYYVKVGKNKGILIDVLIGVKQTYPYSYKYLWNNRLAIEVKVTHAVDPKKKIVLRDNNITTYEATVPTQIRDIIPETPDLLDDESLIQAIVSELKSIYENDKKWSLFGDFIVESEADAYNKENYLILSQVEKELEKYEAEKKVLFEEVQEIDKYKKELFISINELEKKSSFLEEKIEKSNQLISESTTNEQELKRLKKELEEKEIEILSLKNENTELSNEIIDYREESVFKGIIRKFSNNSN